MEVLCAKKLTDGIFPSAPDRHPHLWILTGSGPLMGFGHLRRCMILANELKSWLRPLFILRPHDRWSAPSLETAGFAWLQTDPASPGLWGNGEGTPAAILIDTRVGDGLEEFIQAARRRQAPVLSLHDLGLNPLPSDVAVDGSLASSLLNLNDLTATRTFSGTAYMVLEPDFQLLHQRVLQIRPEIKTILINLGGGDARVYFTRVLEGLRLWAKESTREISVVAMRGFVEWGQDDFTEASCQPLTLRWERGPVSHFIRNADLAITAGGVSAYEALCAGTPLLALSWDNWQQLTISCIAMSGGCISLGDGAELVPERLAGILSGIDANQIARQKFARRGQELVDGRGAERVAAIIRRLVEKTIPLGTRETR